MSAKRDGARPMLVVLSGLPGVGKTALARALAVRLGAAHVRVDSLEQSLRGKGKKDVGTAGYEAAYAEGQAALARGRAVVADSVNPVAASRAGWRACARRAGARVFEVEVVCSDAAEHRRRVERREADIAGLELPSWKDVQARNYEPWPPATPVVDTANRTPAACAAEIVGKLEETTGA